MNDVETAIKTHMSGLTSILIDLIKRDEERISQISNLQASLTNQSECITSLEQEVARLTTEIRPTESFEGFEKVECSGDPQSFSVEPITDPEDETFHCEQHNPEYQDVTAVTKQDDLNLQKEIEERRSPEEPAVCEDEEVEERARQEQLAAEAESRRLEEEQAAKEAAEAEERQREEQAAREKEEAEEKARQEQLAAEAELRRLEEEQAAQAAAAAEAEERQREEQAAREKEEAEEKLRLENAAREREAEEQAKQEQLAAEAELKRLEEEQAAQAAAAAAEAEERQREEQAAREKEEAEEKARQEKLAADAELKRLEEEQAAKEAAAAAEAERQRNEQDARAEQGATTEEGNLQQEQLTRQSDPQPSTELIKRSDVPPAVTLTADYLNKRLQVIESGDVLLCMTKGAGYGWKKLKEITPQEAAYKATIIKDPQQPATPVTPAGGWSTGTEQAATAWNTGTESQWSTGTQNGGWSTGPDASTAAGWNTQLSS